MIARVRAAAHGSAACICHDLCSLKLGNVTGSQTRQQRACTPCAAGVVLLKGRAACEIDTADELLTAELMFNGTLIGLDKHQLVRA